MDVTVCKLPNEDGNGFIRLETEWYSEAFTVILFHSESVWTGKVSAEEIKLLSQCLSMDIGDYMCDTRKALSSHGGSKDFSYAILEGRFLWKKLVDNDKDLKIRFGSVLLEEVPPFEMFECMLDTAIDINYKLQCQLDTLELGKIELESEKEELFKKLTHYQKEKTEMEETLYSNFLDLLNAKKKRIRALEKYIDRINLQPNTETNESGSINNSKNIVFDSDSDPADSGLKSGDHFTDKSWNIFKTPLRSVIKESDDEEPPPKVLPKRRRQTKASSAGKRKVSDSSHNKKSSSVGKRKVSNTLHSKESTSSSTVCLPDSTSSQPSTSFDLSSVSVEAGQHYDSETDVDQCSDEENNMYNESMKVIAGPFVKNTIDSLFDDIRKPAPTCVLPKRVRCQHIPKSNETSISTTNVLDITSAASSNDLKPVVMVSDNRRRQLDTQELLDELFN